MEREQKKQQRDLSFSESNFKGCDQALLKLFLLAREIDRREALLMRQGQGQLALSAAGHEALAVLARLLNPADLIFPYYRDRPLLLARGVTTENCASNFFASTYSSSGGRSESVLHNDHKLGIFSAAGPTGIQCLPAVGAAWGLRHKGLNEALVLCTIGDAATRQGEFYEALALAVQWKLPIVFVVEDNGYGISTPTAAMQPLQLALFDQQWIVRIDGRDPQSIEKIATPAIARVRRGHGPIILWCELDRLDAHIGGDDHRVYRSETELAQIQQRDPLLLLKQRLIRDKLLGETEYRKIRQTIRQKVEHCYIAAALEPRPDPAEVATNLLAPIPPVAKMLHCPHRSDPTLVEAFNATLAMALESDPKVIVFGQDVEDPKGGVFGYTKGLSSRFPEQVINAPLAEATIVGAGIGLAAVGLRPVCELQFIDFAAPAFHQLANNAVNLRWRSNGDWCSPLVLYAPYGAYVNSGFWHTASNEAWFTHMPGLRVAVPSTPEDVSGLLWTALQADDPTLLLLPKNLARLRRITDAYTPVPFGKAVTRNSGDDVTLVAWGGSIALCEIVVQRLAAEGIGIDLLDLRSLVPCDWDAILASLTRTGRLVVVQEDVRTSSFGQAVIAEISVRAEGFYTFLHEPQLISRADIYIGFAPELEAAVLPNIEAVTAAIHRALA